jgi:threonine-phosphate decarboxylase
MSDELIRYHGGNIYAAARDSGLAAADFLDFSANINPLGLSPQVRAALLSSLDSVVCYPDPDAVALKITIADTYQVCGDCIETGNGAVELIYLLCRALSPKRVLLPAPTFGEYAGATRAAGLPISKIPLSAETNFIPDIAAISAALQPDDLLFFCNPNNPTGVIMTCEQLEPLIAQATAIGAHVVVDESFIDFRPTERAESCRGLVGRYRGVTVLHSLTKFLAVPGLRLGFLLGQPALVQQLEKMRDPWNVNVMAQAAGVAGLKDLAYRQETVRLVGREKEDMARGLQAISGIKVLPPSVNFVLVGLGATGWNAELLQQRLWQERILIRNCASFTGLSDRYIRLAVKQQAENQRLIDLLKMIMCKEEEA